MVIIIMPRDFINLSQRQKRRIVSKNNAYTQKKKISISEPYPSSVPSSSSLIFSPSSFGNNNSTSSKAPPRLIKSDSTSSLAHTEPQIRVQSRDTSNLSDWPIHDIGSSSDSESASEPHFFNNIHLEQAVERQTVTQNIFSDDLRHCFVNHSVSHSFINDLLHIFHKHNIHPDLPKDARTFMETPTRSNKLNIRDMGEGKYIHFGLENNIQKTLVKHCIQYNPKYPDKSVINLNINIDGLPISKSSGSQFWPILGDIILDGIYTDPFVIGMYHGLSKPNDSNEFLSFFVEEYQNIEATSIIINNKTFFIKLKGIICDAPAKAFICNIKSHTGYFGCSKCLCEGDYIEGKVVFLSSNSNLRTNDSFRRKIQPEHHKGTSILETLDIDMVKQVPLDYMHLVLLGVTKRVLTLWLKGSQDVRLKKNDIEKLNNIYVAIQPYVTSDFARKPRNLVYLDRFKATEFRLILLYIGPVILASVLKRNQYEHFLSLFVAIRLLCEKNQTLQNIAYADNLLKYYVDKFSFIFGREYVTYNVHNLIHLAEDVKVHGNLDRFSAFKYENKFTQFKKKLKTSRLPLQQIYNRITEEQLLMEDTRHIKNYPHIVYKNNTIYKIELSNITLSLGFNENCCFLTDEKIVLIQKFDKTNNDIICTGRYYVKSESFFYTPCDSKFIIYEIPCRNCNKVYIGQTSQYLKNRINGHKYDKRNKTDLSNHEAENKHSFDFENTKILKTETNTRKREFFEMMYIQKNRHTVNYKTDTRNLTTHKKARKKAECPDYTSTNDECEVKGRGKRVKKLANFDNDDTTSDEDRISPPPLPPQSSQKPLSRLLKLHVQPKKVDQNQSQDENNTVWSQAIENEDCGVAIIDNTAISQIVENLEDIPIQIIGDPLPNKTIDDLFDAIERIAQMCLKTQKYVQELEKSVKKLICLDNENVLNENNLKKVEEHFPLKTKQEIEKFEDYFTGDEETKQLCATYFKRVGGKDMKDHVNRILGQLFSNELGTKLSWFGLRGNENISKFKFMKHLVEVITDKYHTNCAAVEKQVNEWFRLAKQRLGRTTKNKDEEIRN